MELILICAVACVLLEAFIGRFFKVAVVIAVVLAVLALVLIVWAIDNAPYLLILLIFLLPGKKKD